MVQKRNRKRTQKRKRRRRRNKNKNRTQKRGGRRNRRRNRKQTRRRRRQNNRRRTRNRRRRRRRRNRNQQHGGGLKMDSQHKGAGGGDDLQHDHLEHESIAGEIEYESNQYTGDKQQMIWKPNPGVVAAEIKPDSTEYKNPTVVEEPVPTETSEPAEKLPHENHTDLDFNKISSHDVAKHPWTEFKDSGATGKAPFPDHASYERL